MKRERLHLLQTGTPFQKSDFLDKGAMISAAKEENEMFTKLERLLDYVMVAVIVAVPFFYVGILNLLQYLQPAQ